MPSHRRTVRRIVIAALLLATAAPASAGDVAAGRRKALFLVLLIAPFWISYMMRMFAWVNLLQDDGLFNKVLSLGGLLHPDVKWLTGQPVVVVLGLAYGYVPYMILPLYAGLDRLQTHVLEAAHDLGAGRFETFRRVTLPLSWRSITMPISRVPKPTRRARFGTGPPRSFQSSSSRGPCSPRSTVHLKSSLPAADERLPYLLALVASSCSAEDSAKDGSGSRKTSGPASVTRSI